MNRTIAEIAKLGNPFAETVSAAKMLVSRRSDQDMYRWEANETTRLGAVDARLLATYGLAIARTSGRSRYTALTSVEE